MASAVSALVLPVLGRVRYRALRDNGTTDPGFRIAAYRSGISRQWALVLLSLAVLVAAGAFLPLGLLSPVGGALADRLPRRPVLMLGNAAAAGTAVGLAILVADGQGSPLALVASDHLPLVADFRLDMI